MRGDAQDQGLLWDANVLCDDLLDDEGFLATLGRVRGVLFRDSDFDSLYPVGLAQLAAVEDPQQYRRPHRSLEQRAGEAQQVVPVGGDELVSMR